MSSSPPGAKATRWAREATCYIRGLASSVWIFHLSQKGELEPLHSLGNFCFGNQEPWVMRSTPVMKGREAARTWASICTFTSVGSRALAGTTRVPSPELHSWECQSHTTICNWRSLKLCIAIVLIVSQPDIFLFQLWLPQISISSSHTLLNVEIAWGVFFFF